MNEHVTLDRQPGEGAKEGAGHRLAPHTADCVIEAWGPDRASCFTQALTALVEEFAGLPSGDLPPSEVLPLAAGRLAPEDALVSLVEDVLYAVDALAVVPIRFHLAETGHLGVAGEMEVVPVGEVEPRGPVPKAISYHGLTVERGEGGGWHCRAVIDV